MSDPRNVSTDTTLRIAARACFDAAIASVAARRLVEQVLHRDGDALVLETPAGRAVHRGPVLLVGAGKAALGMAKGAAMAAPAATGTIIVPLGAATARLAGVAMLGGAHPVPDAAGEAATARVLTEVEAAGSRTLVLAVLSGGASALLVAPAGDLTLSDKQALTARLLASGADIRALNTVRKHCSRIKGGGLLRAARRAAGVWALLLSDVVGDDPAVIASGPTVADPTTFRDALDVLERWLAPG